VDSLDELYRTDLTGYVLGGIKDCFSRWHYKALGMDDGDVYINSGILLIDIDEWRKEGIEQRMLGKINQCNGKSLQGDQGLINTVLKGRVKNLPLRYNILTYYYDFTYDEIKLYRKPLNCYSKTEIDNAKSNPAIVHFTSSFASIRPWKTNESNHPYYNEWKKEYEKLGGKIKQQGKGVILTVYQRMPHFIALAIIGLVHAYVKPIRYMMKEKITL
jgi:lipopolysaccharide biosynthesis glycosyltransferase